MFKFICIFFLFISCSSTRLLSRLYPDQQDIRLFPLRHFPASNSTVCLPTKFMSIDSSLLTTNTIAFLVVQNDSLAFEYYASNYESSTPFNVFSISKAVVGCMTGIAIGDGYIKGSDDYIYDYLTNIPTSYQSIHIIDLLNMQSGLRSSKTGIATFYYSSHLRKTMKQPSRIYSSNVAKYSNQATQLLMAVIEKATHRDFASYFYDRIWIPLHTENLGSWSFDSHKYYMARGFCGLNITARDLVKFGQIYLHDGLLNNCQIAPSEWIAATFSPPEDAPTSSDSPYRYSRQWRVITPHEEIVSRGLDGQYLYINKPKNLIIIRLGTKNDRKNWISAFQQIAKQF